MKARYHIQGWFRALGELFQDQWFDLSRNVRTSGNVSLAKAGIEAGAFRDSEIYQPARPAHIRRSLREIPVSDLSSFTYIDLGSGKGRTLFIAAEFAFKQVMGVELSQGLHQQACANIRRFRFCKRRCRNIEAHHQNAADFPFPSGDLVLYLFNPFGRATMERVLANLQNALAAEARQLIVILLWPRCADQVAAMGLRVVRETPQYQIFALPPPLPDHIHAVNGSSALAYSAGR